MPKKITPTKPSVKRTTKPAARKPAPPKKRPRPPVPGLLPVPPEVLELLERELKDHPVTDKERQRLTDMWNMQYYFGGEYVAYRDTPQGAYVLAVGWEKVRKVLQPVPANATPDYHITYAFPW